MYSDITLIGLSMAGGICFGIAGTIVWTRTQRELGTPTCPADNAPVKDETPREPTFYYKGTEWDARGYPTVSGFVVRGGSIVRRLSLSSLPDAIHELRQHMEDTGVLVDDEDSGERLLCQDFEFDSTTAAASFVAGRKAPGPTAWKLDNGVTFGQYLEGGAIDVRA